MCPEASLNSAGGYGTLTPTTNRPVEMTSAGTVAAIEGTATGPATGDSVAGRPSPRSEPPPNCQTPSAPAAPSSTTPTTASTRRDDLPEVRLVEDPAWRTAR